MPASPTFRNLPVDKQERILDEALTEFAEHGYGRASVNSLVGRLGISKGSIFQYFHDKPGLFRQVFDFAVERVKNNLRQVRSETQGQDVFTRLEKSLLAGLTLIEAHPRLFRLYLRIVFEGDVPFRGALLQSIRFFSRDYLLELLSEAKQRGELKPDADLDLAAFLVDAALERFLVARSVEHMDLDLGLYGSGQELARRRARELVAMLKAGLGA